METPHGNPIGSDSSPEGSGEQLLEPFRVADWDVDPASNRLNRGEEVATLEPRVMEVLVYLAGRPGAVVTRPELEANVWAGTIVGYDSVTRAVQKLRKAFGDDPKHPAIIETVSKRGYRLVATVRPAGERPAAVQVAQAAAESVQLPRRWPDAAWVVLLTLAVAVVGGLLWGSAWRSADTNGVGESTPKSIAVLPFANMSGDRGQEYFVDGITEDLITNLSRLSNLVVIAPDTSFTYKGEDILAQKVGDDLGVAYILQGSVRKSGDQLRITAQLVDTANGNHIWAERYDRKLVEVFALQDEVTEKIVSALAITLTTQERELLARPVTSSFEAYDLFLQGQQYFRQRTQESNELAKQAYRRAIELDPTYARAYGGLAVALTVDVRQGWAESPIEAQEQALLLARKAVALDSMSPHANWALGFVYLYRRQFDEAIDALERTVALSPNYADGYGALALISNFLGQPEEAIAYIRKGIELNPYYTYEYPFNLGLAFYLKGNFPEAVEALEDAVERNANTSFPRLCLAASYVGLGRPDRAKWEVEQLQLLYPGTTLSHVSNTLPFRNPDQLNSLLEHLREAGLSE
jgi:TolB-like protein/DNA-binding winged helix-turn-helix (wHTH) protein/Flp pilus assembly protein TadD